ncbi:MFS transporter [Tumebacillus permanentifrigoris]|uniref:MFS-type transporter involved in bile tolerance (Atg22 family) n=1 Tax=Tumebacillus permanentifrigoris TaxID=378543 RepID=A0A316DRG4_9BACL|nr:MFS transporter [Tumebacillus permanentifrigoris]PWK07409.1 MFS-type transporter involved in bile tolerance (Atg22 family) [Tumebacillus permanentifrigoris]
MLTILQDRRMLFLLLANILSSIGSGITMLGVPWLLVNRAGGEAVFGYMTLGTTMILFLVSPYIGVIVDRFSRKQVLLFSEVVGGSIVFCMALWGALAGQYETWQLITTYFGGSLYYSLHFTTQFAFTQEIFNREQYQMLNGIMEVQNQTASMIAGALASVLLDRIELSTILMFDAATYAVGFLLFLGIPYKRAQRPAGLAPISVWRNISEGYRYLREKPLLTLFLTCSFMTFLVLMVGNYLFPIYVTQELQAGADVLGLADMCYAIGAILAGLSIPVLVHRLGAFRSIVLTFSSYTVAIGLIGFFPLTWLYMALKLLLGWGNAGTRVARNTVMMELVPNALMGRVNSFFNAFGMGTRVLLLAIFTRTIATTGPALSLVICCGILGVCFAGVLAGRKLFGGKEKTSTA